MAVSPATVPAITNARMTAGPPTGTACVSTMKMPVPIVAPTPNSVSWKRPMLRASSPSPSPPWASVPVSSVMIPTGFRRRTCSFKDAIAPLLLVSLDVAGEQVRPRLAAHHPPCCAVCRKDHRDAAGPVVVVRHREAVGPGRRDGEYVADARRVEADALDEDVAALAVTADDGDLLAGGLEPSGEAGLEALVEQRHLQVVAHAAVDGDERDVAALDGDDAVERRGRRRHHAASWLDDHLGLGGQVLAGGSDQRVEI